MSKWCDHLELVQGNLNEINWSIPYRPIYIVAITDATAPKGDETPVITMIRMEYVLRVDMELVL